MYERTLKTGCTLVTFDREIYYQDMIRLRDLGQRISTKLHVLLLLCEEPGGTGNIEGLQRRGGGRRMKGKVSGYGSFGGSGSLLCVWFGRCSL